MTKREIVAKTIFFLVKLTTVKFGNWRALFIMETNPIYMQNDFTTATSPIFGQHDILHVVQTSKVFKDSKCFVDLKLKREPEFVQAAFSKMAPNFSARNLRKFLKENFDLAIDSEFDEWDPPDWMDNIDDLLLKTIHQPALRSLVREIHLLWKVLSKATSSDIREKPSLSTSIPLPHGFIIPGGRFKETYYWDTYWIIRGLLKSKMEATAKGIIENFLHLIDCYGYVPNGTRTYYLAAPSRLFCSA